jgi:gluconate 2-dehydrogenase gamma chain
MASMNRRDALRLLATGTALHLAPGSLLAAMREARKLVEAPVASRTLSPHQHATAKTLAELLLPRTDTPGATDVGTAEFIDLMLTEWFDEHDRILFLNGLAEVDLRTKTLFSQNFVDASPDQQAEILTWLGQKMTLAADPVSRGRRGSSRGQYKDFYSMFRSLTLTAYYTSEAGATGELHFQMVPGSYDGCVEVPSAKGSAENE